MSIQVLSSDVIDQIAAGEVVERPAHLVKELLENAIDAGALQIEIDFSEGGRRVRVVDNGSGMNPHDLTRAFARHATSKISQSEDLWKLQTYGFRGEALASIAAVSQIVALSKTSEAPQASRLHLDFGKLGPLELISGLQGTTIQVSDLFANIPARRKFLKSDAAETNQIRQVIKALALAHPEVGFRWLEGGQLQAHWPGVDSELLRAQQVLDLQNLFAGEMVGHGLHIRAAMASPEVVAKTSKNIWIFAQGRWIQDRALTAACIEAYRNLLMHGEFPNCCVWIECAPDQIDVNVHPTKSQVKFQDPSMIFRGVFHALRDTLEKGPWLKPSQAQVTASTIPGPAILTSTPDPSLSGEYQGAEKFSGAAKYSGVPQTPGRFLAAEFEQVQYKQKSFSPSHMTDLGQGVETYSAEGPSHQFTTTTMNTSMTATTGPWSRLQVLGQAAQTYMVCQSDQALVLIDQHAAHERVVFEKLLARWKESGTLEIQQFLFPLALDFGEEQLEALLGQESALLILGISWERLGPLTLGIVSAPSFLKETALARALRQLSEELVEQGQSFVFEKYMTDLFATMACHSVVRAGQALSIEQMRELLVQMDEFPLSSYCPHGRPVSVEYTFAKLEKEFGRKV